MRSATLGLLVICFASACAEGSRPPARSPSASPSRARPADEAHSARGSASQPLRVSGEIQRAELLPVLDAGLGRFLQGVRTEPDLQNGRFVGFRVIELYPSDARLSEVDLRPGDTVLRVNGQSIERPEQALHVWEELRVASQLVIEYLRAGRREDLRFEIVD